MTGRLLRHDRPAVSVRWRTARQFRPLCPLQTRDMAPRRVLCLTVPPDCRLGGLSAGSPARVMRCVYTDTAGLLTGFIRDRQTRRRHKDGHLSPSGGQTPWDDCDTSYDPAPPRPRRGPVPALLLRAVLRQLTEPGGAHSLRDGPFHCVSGPVTPPFRKPRLANLARSCRGDRRFQEASCAVRRSFVAEGMGRSWLHCGVMGRDDRSGGISHMKWHFR